jgi:hypothetical protein
LLVAAAPAPSAASTLVVKGPVVLKAEKDPPIEGIDFMEVYNSEVFDLSDGKTYPQDEGKGHFGVRAVLSGRNDGTATLLSVVQKKNEKHRAVSFVNLGKVAFEAVKQAPADGYSDTFPERRFALPGVKAGDVVAFRVTEDGSKPTYGKIKFATVGLVSVFDYAWQKNGTRKLTK